MTDEHMSIKLKQAFNIIKQEKLLSKKNAGVLRKACLDRQLLNSIRDKLSSEKVKEIQANWLQMLR